MGRLAIALSAAAVCILAAACFCSACGSDVPAGQAEARISEHTQISGSENLTVDIRLPVVSGLNDLKFEKQLNEAIENQIDEELHNAIEAADLFWREAEAEGFEPWPYTFFAEYGVKSTNDILSLKVTALLYTGGPGQPRTICYNADIRQNKLLKLGDLFNGERYRQAVNSAIVEQMDKDPGKYVSPDEFAGVSEQTMFFIYNRELYITFAKYEVAPGMTGEPEFLIPAEKISGLLKREYRELLY